MAVTFDANASPTSQTANGVNGLTGFTTTTSLLTVGSGSNRALIIPVNLSLVSASSVACVWDTGGTNQAMTLSSSQSFAAGGWAGIFTLVAPTSGAKNAKVTWNNATSDIIVGGTSWTSVDQTGGATSFPHATNSTGTAPTMPALVITSAVGNATMACVTTAGTPSAPTQTETYLNVTPTNESGDGTRAAGAATVTHGWSISGVSAWVAVGIDLLAFTASGDTQEWLPRWAPHRPIRDINTLY